ncbi:hypothetical protein [uncultured Zoogloea sp.]|uniref:hypothetical protein n=1 Tax=uncultured Zoogloea sp. TaxID=160237 RepID=UPI00262ED7E9|nr:hypothetical protein [uncultured Zoogloea sp.]
MTETNDPAVAIAAASEWANLYRALYLANAQATWTASDQDRMEDALEKLWDESVGKYLDPADIALDAALERFAPTLAAMVGWLSAPATVFFYALLAPSPVANDFTEAKLANNEISELVLSKLPVPTQGVIQLRFTPYVNGAFQECKGGTLP